jgi:hypothetical protein
MRTLIFSILLIITTALPNWQGTQLHAQGIGEIAPEKPPEVFPSNAWGFDFLIGESGFGFGGFFRKQFGTKFTLFADMSISEAKDEREIEYIDVFGQTFTIGKKNRVFQIPFNFGAQFRLFEKELADNLRPYINAGVGPTIVLTTPYSEEFFNAFGSAQTHFGAGGYVGFGANFGLDKSNLIGLNLRYYYVSFFDEGVEILEGRNKDHLSGFFITLNFGFMY